MITDSLERQGSWCFRWRSYVLLGFAPIILLTISQPEPVKTYFGRSADEFYEAFCIAIALQGSASALSPLVSFPAVRPAVTRAARSPNP
jgi:hypothetical protein